MKKNWMVLMLLAAFVLLASGAIACGDAGDAVCNDCYDDESVTQTNPADKLSEVTPAQEPAISPTCELSLAVGQSGNLELWACYNDAYDQGNRAAKISFDCWEGSRCEASFEAATPLNPQSAGCAFVVLTGHLTGVLRNSVGGWIDPTADCQMYDGIVWQSTSDGGYLKWPAASPSGG